MLWPQGFYYCIRFKRVFFPFGQCSLAANHFGYGCSVNVLLLWPQGFYNCMRFNRFFFLPLDNAHLRLTTLGMGVCSVPWLLWACIGAWPLLHQGPCLPAPGHKGAAITAQWHQGDVCILVCVFSALLSSSVVKFSLLGWRYLCFIHFLSLFLKSVYIPVLVHTHF